MNFIGVRAVQWQSKKKKRKERKNTQATVTNLKEILNSFYENVDLILGAKYNSKIKGNRSKNYVFHFG